MDDENFKVYVWLSDPTANFIESLNGVQIDYTLADEKLTKQIEPQNLGESEDLAYFKTKLFTALNFPIPPKILSVQDMRENIKHTYAWDFVLAEGDTIKEKYSLLANAIRTMTVRKSGKNAYVVAGKGVCSAIVVSIDLNDGFKPVYQKKGEYLHVSDYDRVLGAGLISGYQLYESDELKDEIFVFYGGGDEEVNLIKVFNMI